ncbi:TPA: VWA-like domain-containing protein [Pseudomonas aeruginosa]
MQLEIKTPEELRTMLDLAFGVHPALRALAPLYHKVDLRIGDFDWLGVPTMGVVGRTVYVHTRFMQERSGPELLFVFAHELVHILLRLTTDQRLRGVQPALLGNIAADLVINLFVEEILLPGSSRFPSIPVPADALYDPKYAGMTFEAVLADLQDSAEDETYQPMDDHIVQPPPDQPPQPPLTEGEASVVAQQMLEARERAGAILGEHSTAGKLLRKIVAGNVDPYELLGAHLASVFKRGDGGPSFRRVNRSLVSQGIYLPTPTSRCYGRVAVLCDTSGSNHAGLSRAMGIVLDVLAKVSLKAFALVEWGSDIARAQWLDEAARVELAEKTSFEWADGGGTEVTVALRWIVDNAPDHAIIITDGEIMQNVNTEGENVTWVILPGGSCSSISGDVVRLEK